MAHAHSVYDNDRHFSIDPVTREIKNESGKFKLIRYDHNSERFTFEIPKVVDGHDMSLCNVVQVHYLNIEAGKDGLTYEGLYECGDLQVSPDSADVVIFSWLLSRNATQYAGSLNFVIYFACVAEDGTEEYAWSTDIHTSVTVGEGIYNAEVIAVEYADMLEKWRAETFAMVNETLNDFAETGLADGAVTEPKIAPSAVTTPKIDDGAVTRAKLANDALYSPVIHKNGEYYLSADDIGKTIRTNASGDLKIILTQSASAAMPVGAEIAILPWSSKNCTIQFDGVYAAFLGESTTLGDKSFSPSEKYGMIAIKKIISDTSSGDHWLVAGNVEVVA